MNRSEWGFWKEISCAMRITRMRGSEVERVWAVDLEVGEINPQLLIIAGPT
jgi:hypothetical protein